LTQFCSGRVLNIQIGDVTHFTWLGLGELARVTPAGLQKAYHRPSLLSDTVPEWFIPTRGLFQVSSRGRRIKAKRASSIRTCWAREK
jgi:hypothetical protein